MTQYPKGKLNNDDQGLLQTGIAYDEETNRIIINFFKPVHWIGLDSDSAFNLLISLAEKLSKMLGLKVRIVIDEKEEIPEDSII